MSNRTMTVALTIAGSDSGGGAGVQADLKTFEAFGLFGTSAITSVTAQNTVGVRAVHDVPAGIVREQIVAVLDDFTVRAIKIGMLSNAEIVRTVADVLRERAPDIPIVLDPVMVATSGDRLLKEDAVEAIIRDLIPLAWVATPNAPEAEVLSGLEVRDIEGMNRAAKRIAAMGARAVLVKGGHVAEREMIDGQPWIVDVLMNQAEGNDGNDEPFRMQSPLLETTSTHGTGCTLSAAIAAHLALGYGINDAVRHARLYLHQAIRRAPGIGHGHGPLRHGWKRSLTGS